MALSASAAAEKAATFEARIRRLPSALRGLVVSSRLVRLLLLFPA